MNRHTRCRIILSLVISALAITVAARAQGSPSNRAGLVIVHGDGSVDISCIEFTEERITGGELLQRADKSVVLGVYGGLGYGVCEIDDEGCAAGMDCFCQCRSSPCAYWVYSHLQPDGNWAISGVGASSWQIGHGDVDGWVFGDGSRAPPEGIVFDDVCRSEPTTPAPGRTARPPQDVTPAPLPASGLSPTAAAAGSAEPDATPGEEPKGIDLRSYGAFGVIVLTLAAWLIASALRRKAV